jgi:lipopolysaccharide/colanic/teichoic acid biosynthesis glycosyltransferase
MTSMPTVPEAESTPVIRDTRRGQRQIALKRLADIAIGVPLGILLLPLCAILAVAVKLDSAGSVIYSSDRVGEGGRSFRLYKFRSMVSGASLLLPDLAHLNAGGDRMIKIPNDPRVTRLGRILRRYSLDEIPQLWNVVKGDLSLVGPRPQSPSEVALYDDHQRRRLSVPQGLTGLWQVTARHSSDFDVWVAKDLEYIDSWSLWLDCKILLKTVGIVLLGQDASPSAEPAGRD